jgi:hypothetical protein
MSRLRISRLPTCRQAHAARRALRRRKVITLGALVLLQTTYNISRWTPNVSAATQIVHSQLAELVGR